MFSKQTEGKDLRKLQFNPHTHTPGFILRGYCHLVKKTTIIGLLMFISIIIKKNKNKK